MDIYQVSEKFNISLQKLNNMRRAGVLNVSSDDPHVGKIRSYVRRGRTIPALELVHLYGNPETLLDLGRYAEEAERALNALELPDNYEAPLDIVAEIDLAAKDDPEPVASLCEWMKATIPSEGCAFAYLAVRLLIGSSEHLAKYNAPRIAQAFLNVRKLEQFAGYWEVQEIRGQRVTKYLTPRKKEFDL